ncbi:collagenase [Streptomyces sp. NPDC101118]|uniref:collagenase n=1 Tax=Streptomyces sp. NPDC101118 TaxID=3366109 RepID=UPI00380D2ECB
MAVATALLAAAFAASPTHTAQAAPADPKPDHVFADPAQRPAHGTAKGAPGPTGTTGGKLESRILPIVHTCSPTLRIRAQEMTAAQLTATCASLADQDAYFHNVVKDPGPVAGDLNTTLEVDVFNSSADYKAYAGRIYGIDTNNGGMYLEGDPSRTGNQPRFICYERTDVSPGWQIWNLNHEYTHYLDGRFDLYGDFGASQTTPTVWWGEGIAEYVSYSYRGVAYANALAEAGKHTYSLRTLFDTTYANSDVNRTYNWGYLAARYMVERHPADVATVLAHYRTGNWTAARAFLTSLDYESDWNAWLTSVATTA